jgi:hypothetical protein
MGKEQATTDCTDDTGDKMASLRQGYGLAGEVRMTKGEALMWNLCDPSFSYFLVSIGVIRGQTAFLFLFVSIRVHS